MLKNLENPENFKEITDGNDDRKPTENHLVGQALDWLNLCEEPQVRELLQSMDLPQKLYSLLKEQNPK